MPSPCTHPPEAQSGEAYTAISIWPVAKRSFNVLGSKRAEGKKTTAKTIKASDSFKKLRPTFSAPPLCFSFEAKSLGKAIYPIGVSVGVGVGVWVAVEVGVGVEVGKGVGVGTLSKMTRNL